MDLYSIKPVVYFDRFTRPSPCSPLPTPIIPVWSCFYNPVIHVYVYMVLCICMKDRFSK